MSKGKELETNIVGGLACPINAGEHIFGGLIPPAVIVGAWIVDNSLRVSLVDRQGHTHEVFVKHIRVFETGEEASAYWREFEARKRALDLAYEGARGKEVGSPAGFWAMQEVNTALRRLNEL